MTLWMAVLAMTASMAAWAMTQSLQVLELIITGASNRQIGRTLGITERTVKVHVGNLFRRIGVADRCSQRTSPVATSRRN